MVTVHSDPWLQLCTNLNCKEHFFFLTFCDFGGTLKSWMSGLYYLTCMWPRQLSCVTKWLIFFLLQSNIDTSTSWEIRTKMCCERKKATFWIIVSASLSSYYFLNWNMEEQIRWFSKWKTECQHVLLHSLMSIYTCTFIYKKSCSNVCSNS